MKSSVLFQNHPVLELKNETDHLLLSPQRGARLLQWKHLGREVITWPEQADWSQILKVRGGNPILFPFLARHFVEGKNELWRDAAGTVRSMPQHGFARDAEFSVIEEAAPETVRMRLTESAWTLPFYPFAFQFDVVVQLQPRSCVEIRLETTNTGDQPLPYYAGHHFYFALPHRERCEWTAHLPCAFWARQDGDGQILPEEAVDETLRLDDLALIDRFQVHPLGSKITLQQESAGRRLSLELVHPGSIPWYAVTTWTQAPESDFFCLEPWLGLPNAIHHGQGLRWLPPGKKESATVVIDAIFW